MYSALFMAIYGIPCSIFSDFISGKISNKQRDLISLGFHILFGAMFFLFFGLFDIALLISEPKVFFILTKDIRPYAVFGAVLFWATDNLINSLNKK